MVNGGLVMKDFETKGHQFYETADQTVASTVNQFSCLIAQVISPVLHSVGLNEMTFEYSVRDNQGIPEHDFRTYAAAPAIVVPGNDTRSMAKAAEIELVNGIFRTIFGSKGDFHVWVDVNVTGITSVRLTLVGMGYPTPPPFEIPSVLGGLTSPLIGDEFSQRNNAQEVEQLYHVANNNATGLADSQESNQFGQYAQDWFNRQPKEMRLLPAPVFKMPSF
jgi:hypothetical protein